MKKHVKTLTLTGLVLLLTVSMSMLYAADGNKSDKGERPDRGDRSARGGFNRDPEQMQKMMLDRVKQQIEASDEEWTVIEPRISNVMKLSMQSRFGGMRSMMGGPGGPGGREREDGQDSPAKSGIEKAAEELQTVLKDTEATPEQIKAKLAVLRKEKEKSQTELITAKAELVSVLTLRQEATLVGLGMLD